MIRFKSWFVLAGITLGCLFPVEAQQGDKKGEVQQERVPKELIPPAPPLSPAEALESFQIDPRFRVELVAAEPMVDTPVAITFGADGDIWVVEMRGYMPNPDGKGEKDIPGRIVRLQDTDRDGRADRRTVFLDNLVMPRAIAVAGDGLLVAEPPHLWFWRDTDGDGKADDKTRVADDYGSQANPEHTANGLVRAMDNWYYSLYHTHRYRYQKGKWSRQAIPNRVQWGLTQDNYGRLYFTSNSDQLRGDLYPSHYVGDRPKVRLPGINTRVASDQTVWPTRVNPGVNRGYQPKTLRDDGRLARFTAACGTGIYRGDLFPGEFVGRAFVCEPSGNLIRCNTLEENDGMVSAKNAYGEGEFMTSSDERFRPVNVYTGPEGALYIVDIYHGIVQHRIYLTTYLRKQILDRGLDKPLHMGRIYRVVPKGKTPDRPVGLSTATPLTLVNYLAHPNGWVRDMAQQLLVEKGDESVVSSLRGMARDHEKPLARLHAAWTLEGMGAADLPTVSDLLKDEDPKLRRAALRLAEPNLKVFSEGGTAELKQQLLALVQDPREEVRIQVALTLGSIAFTPDVKQSLVALKNEKGNVQKYAAYSLELREPAKKPTNNIVKAAPLSKEHQALFDKGKEMYEITCIACHQAHGLGQEGLAPPLAGSEWVGASAERLGRIVLQGLRGPITVKGQVYEIDMPALDILDDEQIASVLTFIRRNWGHAYDPIEPATISKIRKATGKRVDAWTEAELLKIP